MNPLPRWLGVADDQEGCLFQAFAVGIMAFGLIASSANGQAATYATIATIFCCVGVITVLWAATR